MIKFQIENVSNYHSLIIYMYFYRSINVIYKNERLINIILYQLMIAAVHHYTDPSIHSNCLKDLLDLELLLVQGQNLLNVKSPPVVIALHCPPLIALEFTFVGRLVKIQLLDPPLLQAYGLKYI